MAALKDNLLKYGVLRTRDLVELYFGWRMVAAVTETLNGLNTDVAGLLLSQDSRRIRYEINMANPDPANPLSVGLASTLDGVDNNPQIYQIPPSSTLVVKRSFLTDLDAVTWSVFMKAVQASDLFEISTRETFLTPAPVDELPLAS